MKKILTPLLYCCLALAIIAGCKKDDFSDVGDGTITAQEYTFNRATKTFDLGNEIKSSISAAEGVKFVYCYLVRTTGTDSLIHVTDNKGAITPTYELSIPITAFPVNNMSKVKGVKIMVKQGNNSSLEGFVNIKYFDPDLPQFSTFPSSITADLNGGATAIAGNIQSEYGIKQVDIYDDYQLENTYVLVNSIANTNNAKQYALNYAYTYRKAAQHIKIVATDIYNQTNELIINMPVDVSIFKPQFKSFAADITPVVGGTTPVSGQITSITGLKKVELYDDRNGSYALLSTKTLAGQTSYNYTENYQFKKRAEHLKIIAIDNDDLQTELIIPLNYTYQSVLYRDVEMNAQSIGTKTGFLRNGNTIGNCELNANEANMYLIFGAQSSGPVLFNPATAATGSIAANLKCNNVGWSPTNTSVIHDTKFRVLIDGASTGQSAIYDLLENGEIDDLSNTFFSSNSISNPSSNNPRFDAAAAPTTSVFNATTARVIFIKITDPSTSVVKNGIIHVKEGVAANPIGNSTIKFDIYIQK